jgi:hypothetical protein
MALSMEQEETQKTIPIPDVSIGSNPYPLVSYYEQSLYQKKKDKVSEKQVAVSALLAKRWKAKVEILNTTKSLVF